MFLQIYLIKVSLWFCYYTELSFSSFFIIFGQWLSFDALEMQSSALCLESWEYHVWNNSEPYAGGLHKMTIVSENMASVVRSYLKRSRNRRHEKELLFNGRHSCLYFSIWWYSKPVLIFFPKLLHFIKRTFKGEPIHSTNKQGKIIYTYI